MKALQLLRQGIQQWLLPVGIVLFCTGLFVATGRTAHKTIVYLGVLAPALAMVVLSPRAAWQAVFGNPVRLALVVFVFWAASSASWAVDQSESDFFLKYAVFITLFALAFSRDIGAVEERVLPAFRVSVVLAGVYAVYSVIDWYVLGGNDWHQRFNGLPPLYNPLVTGYFMGFFLALMMSEYIACQQRRYAFVLYLPVAAAIIVMVLLTQSRTPLLAWFATAMVLALVRRNQRGWAVAVMTISGLALLLAFNETLWERGLSWRPWIWSHVFERALEKPWLGHGFGDELLIVIPQNGWLFHDPHNMHLSVFYYAGVVGLALWVLLLVLAFRAAWQARHTALGLVTLGLLVYGMVACSFDGGYLIARPRENWFTLWLPLAMAARLLDKPAVKAMP